MNGVKSPRVIWPPPQVIAPAWKQGRRPKWWACGSCHVIFNAPRSSDGCPCCDRKQMYRQIALVIIEEIEEIRKGPQP